MRRVVWMSGLVALVCGQLAYGQPLPATRGGSKHAPSLGCGAYARLDGGVITVRPSGGNDSATLQCVLDKAGALGVRDVRLTTGTFHAVSLVANDFRGRLTGAGERRTIIENVPNAVIPADFWPNPPSPNNPWPSMVAFVDGDFVVSLLSLKVTGIPTTGWSILGIEPPIQALAHGFVIVGTEAHAVFEHVRSRGRI